MPRLRRSYFRASRVAGSPRLCRPSIDEFAPFKRALFPCLDGLDVEGPDGFSTADRRALGPLPRGNVFGVWMTSGEPSGLVAPIESVQRLAQSVHVFLRHRLLPQSGGFEPLAPIAVAIHSDELRVLHQEDRCNRGIQLDA